MTCFKYQEDTKEAKYNSISPYISASKTLSYICHFANKQLRMRTLIELSMFRANLIHYKH